MTFTSLLVKFEYVSGCHVLRLQASSVALDTDSRRDHVDPLVEVVGLARMLLEGENAPLLEEFNGVKIGGP